MKFIAFILLTPILVTSGTAHSTNACFQAYGECMGYCANLRSSCAQTCERDQRRCNLAAEFPVDKVHPTLQETDEGGERFVPDNTEVSNSSATYLKRNGQ
jgi:hypothetical protein